MEVFKRAAAEIQRETELTKVGSASDKSIRMPGRTKLKHEQ
jgi:hypothetical protein